MVVSKNKLMLIVFRLILTMLKSNTQFFHTKILLLPQAIEKNIQIMNKIDRNIYYSILKILAGLTFGDFSG